MRAKKMIMMMALVLGIIGIFAANTFAAEANYTCRINQIGGLTAKNGAMYVKLTDTKKNGFKNMLFRIPDGRLNQIMAVLLTAASNGATVTVRADLAIKEPSKRVLKFAYYNPK
jgi:hypothetical protein